jgi:hypothetical protein
MSCGTILNGRRCRGGGSSAQTFSSPDGTIAINVVGDDVQLEFAGGPIAVSSPDGSVDVSQVGNAIELEVVTTPQLFDESGQTPDAGTPLVFTLGTLATDGDALAVNYNITGTSEDGVDLRVQVPVGIVAVRRAGAIALQPAMFVNGQAVDGAGGAYSIVYSSSGDDVLVTLQSNIAAVVNWTVRGFVTVIPGSP